MKEYTCFSIVGIGKRGTRYKDEIYDNYEIALYHFGMVDMGSLRGYTKENPPKLKKGKILSRKINGKIFFTAS